MTLKEYVQMRRSIKKTMSAVIVDANKKGLAVISIRYTPLLESPHWHVHLGPAAFVRLISNTDAHVEIDENYAEEYEKHFWTDGDFVFFALFRK